MRPLWWATMEIRVIRPLNIVSTEFRMTSDFREHLGVSGIFPTVASENRAFFEKCFDFSPDAVAGF